MRIFKCNVCGKDYDLKCEQPMSIDHVLCYPSEHDGESFTLDVCSKCQDAFANTVGAFCVIPPVKR